MARILLIEDSPDFADFVCAVLNLNGHTVTHATTLREGVASALQAPPPELVLLDLALPDGSGLGFLQHVTRDAPVIAMTADTGAEQARHLHTLGLRYIIKPIAARELLDLVTTTLAKGHAHDLSTDPHRR